MENNLLETARRYYAAGLNVLPADRAKKRPLGAWKEYAKVRPEFERVFRPGLSFDALCLVCGATSGGLEILDFDQKGKAADAFFQNALDEFGFEFDDRPNQVKERTQSGGLHLGYRSPAPGRNQKLATDSEGGVLIETRGEGGICLVAPSDGYSLLDGDWTNLPVLNANERERLLSCARKLDESSRKDNLPAKSEPVVSSSLSPTGSDLGRGESVADYLRRDLEPLRAALRRAGWDRLKKEGPFEYWRRPNQPVADKPGGSIDEERRFFHCFTSNAAPFEPSKSYSPLDAIALLDFSGDVSAASKSFAQKRKRDDSFRVYSIRDNSFDEIEIPVEIPPKKTVEFPSSLLRVPGLIGEIEEEVDRRARRPQPGGSFLAGFCAMSYIVGRSIELYCDGATTAPNVYGLFLAPSGMGKEAPRRVASDVARIYDPDDVTPEAFASVQALQNTLTRQRKILWLHDEFGRDLSYMNNERANANIAGIITESLKLYSNANNRAYLPRLRAQEAAGVKRPSPVDRPFLSILATGNPRDFYNSASETLLHNGYVARFTIVIGLEYSPKKSKTFEERVARQDLEFSSDFRARVECWRRFESMNDEKPTLVDFTREADEVLQAYDSSIELDIQKELTTVDGASELKARYSEKLWKYALLFAASKFGPRKFSIDRGSAELAVELVDYESKIFAANAERFSSNESTRFSFDILEWARAVGGAFSKSEFTRKFQRRGTRRDREEVLETLLDGAYLGKTSEGRFVLLPEKEKE